MSKVVCFGEIMLRLSPPGVLQIRQTDRFDLSFAGAEANVAVALQNLGAETAFVSKVPVNAVGVAALDSLKKFCVDCSFSKFGGERLGLYYYEKGAGIRSSQVVYDRKHSAFAGSEPQEYDWAEIFRDADWFHFSGITPALGESLPDILESALRAAKARGITTSCDVNYRGSLWERNRARETIGRFLPYLDLCVSAEDLFLEEGERVEHMDERLRTDFGIRYFVHTRRRMLSARRTEYAIVLNGKEGNFVSRTYDLEIVDRLGCGDAMLGGLIFALREQRPLQEVAEFGVAVGALKHCAEGDYSYVTKESVEHVLSGDDPGRVRR